MKISIVITAYNVEQYIRQAVLSTIQQKHIPNDINADFGLEVLVVNDASTDGTGSILSGIAAELPTLVQGGSATAESPTLRIVTNPTNQGAGMSRRIGIQASTGDYVLLLDGDDYIHPTFIASLCYSAQKYDADIVSGGVTILRNEKVGYYDQTCYGNFIALGTNKLTNFYRERVVFMANKLIRRSLHEKVPYCTRRYIEDTPVIAPQLWYANKVVYTNHPGYIYRMQPESLTHKASEFKGAIFRALCDMDLYEFFRDKESVLSGLFNLNNFLVEVNNMSKATESGKVSDSELAQYAHEIRQVYTFYNKHKHLLQ